MSTLGEVHAFISFLREVFVEKEHCLPPVRAPPGPPVANTSRVVVSPVQYHMSAVAASHPPSDGSSMVASSG